MWPDLTKASFHIHKSKVDFLQPLNFYINELIIHVCIIANDSLVCFPVTYFLGLSDMLKCLGGLQMAVAWLDKHLPSENCHTAEQRAWPSKWLLFVISRAQMGPRWDHPAVFNFYAWKNLLLCGSPSPQPPPLCNHLWYWCKNYLKWQLCSCLLQSWSTERDCITMD